MVGFGLASIECTDDILSLSHNRNLSSKNSLLLNFFKHIFLPNLFIDGLEDAMQTDNFSNVDKTKIFSEISGNFKEETEQINFIKYVFSAAAAEL